MRRYQLAATIGSKTRGANLLRVAVKTSMVPIASDRSEWQIEVRSSSRTRET